MLSYPLASCLLQSRRQHATWNATLEVQKCRSPAHRSAGAPYLFIMAAALQRGPLILPPPPSHPSKQPQLCRPHLGCDEGPPTRSCAVATRQSCCRILLDGNFMRWGEYGVVIDNCSGQSGDRKRDMHSRHPVRECSRLESGGLGLKHTSAASGCSTPPSVLHANLRLTRLYELWLSMPLLTMKRNRLQVPKR